jgi:hypothetical protein
MNKNLLSICIALLIGANLYGQLKSDNRIIAANVPSKSAVKKIASRSASNPKSCDVDTSYFPNQSTSTTGGAYQYQSIIISKGGAVGQFYNAPTKITVSGFRFYGYFLYDSLTGVTNTTVSCNIYRAGPDSLPMGPPISSVDLNLDTVGGTLTIPKIQHDIAFNTPIVCDFPYIITVETDSMISKPNIISNSWQSADGEGRNLASAQVSGIWYRCLDLNVSGTTFNAHMQLYPFVKYDFGTDFTSNMDCFVAKDTLRFTNSFKSNLLGSSFYNSYQYFEELGMGFQENCHEWLIDGNTTYTNQTDAKFKSATKKNISVELRSQLVTYASETCYDTTIKVISFNPANPSLTKTPNGCIGDSLRISVSGDAGSTFNWYKNITDTKPFFVGSSYTIAKVTKSDTFVVQAINGNCSSGYLSVVSRASAYPTKLTFVNDSICSGAVANLVGTSDNGSVEWYNAKTGGTRLFVGGTYVTNELTSDTAFYMTANNFGCIYKGARLRPRVLVSKAFAPTLPKNVKDTTICLGSSASIVLRATPATSTACRWFDDALSNTPLSTGNAYTVSVNARGTQTYFVESWNGNCGSGKLAVNIIAEKAPATFTKAGTIVCLGDSATVFALATYGGVQWYTSKATSSVSSDKRYTSYGLPAGNKKMYFKTVDNTCVNSNWDSVTITVNAAPDVTSITNNDVCFKGIGQITVQVPSGKVNWYNSDIATSVYATGTSVSLGKMYGNTTLYYSTQSGACNGTRIPVTVKALPRPTAGFYYTITPGLTLKCDPIKTTGMTYDWNWGDTKTSTGLPATHQYATTGNYDVTLVTTSTTNICKDTVVIPLFVNSVASVKTFNNPMVSIYPNPAKGGSVLNIKGIVISELHWFDVSGREVAVEKVNNNMTFVPSKLSTGVYFIQGGNAKSSFSGSININN